MMIKGYFRRSISKNIECHREFIFFRGKCDFKMDHATFSGDRIPASSSCFASGHQAAEYFSNEGRPSNSINFHKRNKNLAS